MAALVFQLLNDFLSYERILGVNVVYSRKIGDGCLRTLPFRNLLKIFLQIGHDYLLLHTCVHRMPSFYTQIACLLQKKE
jgi:hypothetical protein